MTQYSNISADRECDEANREDEARVHEVAAPRLAPQFVGTDGVTAEQIAPVDEVLAELDFGDIVPADDNDFDIDPVKPDAAMKPDALVKPDASTIGAVIEPEHEAANKIAAVKAEVQAKPYHDEIEERRRDQAARDLLERHYDLLDGGPVAKAPEPTSMPLADPTPATPATSVLYDAMRKPAKPHLAKQKVFVDNYLEKHGFDSSTLPEGFWDIESYAERKTVLGNVMREAQQRMAPATPEAAVSSETSTPIRGMLDDDELQVIEHAQVSATKPDLAPGCYGMGMVYQPGTETCDKCPFAADCGPLATQRMDKLRAKPGFMSWQDKHNARKAKDSHNYRERERIKAQAALATAAATPCAPAPTTPPKRRGRPPRYGVTMTPAVQKARRRAELRALQGVR